MKTCRARLLRSMAENEFGWSGRHCETAASTYTQERAETVSGNRKCALDRMEVTTSRLWRQRTRRVACGVAWAGISQWQPRDPSRAFRPATPFRPRRLSRPHLPATGLPQSRQRRMVRWRFPGDTYATGDYDVYFRRLKAPVKSGAIEMESAVAAAATPYFEAHSTVAFDAEEQALACV